MDDDVQDAFIKVAEWADDHGYEIFGEQVWYVFETNGGVR